MIAPLLRMFAKRGIKRILKRGGPGEGDRLARRARARSPGSLRARASARGYRGDALRDIARGELPLPPEGHDPYAGCPPGWGYADYVDGSVACLPPLPAAVRRRNRLARRR